MEVQSAQKLNMETNAKPKGRFEKEDERPTKYTLGDNELTPKFEGLKIGAPRDEKLVISRHSQHDDHEWSYTIEPVDTDRREEVLQFLRKFFFKDEPMNQYLGIGSGCPPLEEYSLGSLEEGCSFAAVDTNDRIVGIVLNGPANCQEDYSASIEEKARTCPDARFAHVLRVLARLECMAARGVRERWPEARAALEVRIAATEERWRGRGLLKALATATEKHALCIGTDILRMDATSAFTAYAAERLGYQCIATLAYRDHEVNGERPLDPPAPHTHAKVYVKPLHS